MSQISIADERPPYVRFEQRAEEDRTASIAAGHYVARNVDFALITPMGSKDTIERKVEDWFPQLRQQVSEQRFQAGWLQAYRDIYTAWQEGRELPTSGTPILHWPAVSPSQAQAIIQARIRSVEDLANANEVAIQMIGMGGRALKQKAVDWLAASANSGKLAERAAALEAANSDLQARNKSLEERLAALEARLPADSPHPVAMSEEVPTRRRL
jgi:hypothetical protein